MAKKFDKSAYATWIAANPEKFKAQRQRYMAQPHVKAKRAARKKAKAAANRAAKGLPPFIRAVTEEEKYARKKAYWAKYSKQEKVKQYQKIWKRNNADKCRDSRIRRKYGLERADFEALLVSQNGRCEGCTRLFELDWDKDKMMFPRVDHCHATRNVRGLLCHKCNATLGLVEDSIERLESLIGYLVRTGKR